MAATYKVVKGDCLWNIAAKYLGSGSRWTEIADLNSISKSRPIIYPGQVLTLYSSPEPPPAPPEKVNTTSTPTIQYFGLQAGTDRSVFATWSWDKSNTDHYRVVWDYHTGNKGSNGSIIWFVGSDSTVTTPQSVYSAPTNAQAVRFKVIAVSQKRKGANGTETSYWTGGWSTSKMYDFSDNPPSTPPVPNVTIEDYKLTASLENLNVNATSIQFKVVKDNTIQYKLSNTTIQTTTNSASYTCIVEAGGEYKVCARSVRGNQYSDWSAYSSAEGTIPAVPTGITTCQAKSETSVYLAWPAVTNATSYDIEYTTKLEYFDGSNQTTTVSNIEFTHYELGGLETGSEYFFRVRAVNAKGHSAWSGVKSVAVGEEPAPPTTWSSTTTAVVGEPLTLYWIHNASDNSSQTYAELELIVDGVGEVYTIKNTENEDEKDKTSNYPIDTTKYSEGVKIQWRVRTAGVTLTYGEWSIQRTIDIYAPPTLTLEVEDAEGNAITQLESFPFYVHGLAGPNTQAPIGYHLVITSNEVYETVDSVGNVKMVNNGEEVYSKYFDISTALLVEFSANNVDLQNNVNYTITCSATMNSGLIAEATSELTVAWTDMEYEPNAEIGIDHDTLSAYIRPYCEDENGNLIEGISLSVYRREFDGTFTEIIKNVDNSASTFVTDPHPSLDYARYRIVAVTDATGAVSYYDVPGYPVGEKSVIIQWNEDWTMFDSTSEDELSQPPWSGSLLKLPYNIDVSDSHRSDVSLIEYVGRKRPVSYYGTQLGETATWNVVIEKSDKETLYALRRLAIWMGDVYVREPSGSGYWANITVSFSQKHLDLTIPVSLDIKRVEGGM